MKADANDVKKRAAQLFNDIYEADYRLQILERNVVGPLVDAAVVFNMEGKVVFQAGQLYDQLVARRVPSGAVLEALVVLEPRAAKLGVVVRQPPQIQQLTPEQRSALQWKAPPSRSEIVEEIDAARTPEIIREARKQKSRRVVLWAGCVVLAVGAAALAVYSLPKGLDKAAVTFSAAAVPCTEERAASKRVFCIVDERAIASEPDDVVRLRMKRAQEEAKAAGFDAVAFLKPGVGPDGEQHRFRPWLWERDPVVKGGAPASTVPPRATPPRAPSPGAP